MLSSALVLVPRRGVEADSRLLSKPLECGMELGSWRQVSEILQRPRAGISSAASLVPRHPLASPRASVRESEREPRLLQGGSCPQRLQELDRSRCNPEKVSMKAINAPTRVCWGSFQDQLHKHNQEASEGKKAGRARSAC